MDPAFLHNMAPLNGETQRVEVVTYFCFIFKGKQNKKENSKCDSLFGKDNLWKTKVEFGSQVICWECTIKIP